MTHSGAKVHCQAAHQHSNLPFVSRPSSNGDFVGIPEVTSRIVVQWVSSAKFSTFRVDCITTFLHWSGQGGWEFCSQI